MLKFFKENWSIVTFLSVLGVPLISFVVFKIYISWDRMLEDINRQNQEKENTTIVEQYSGGRLVNSWKFKGIVNSSEHSDGYYFTIKDTLVEVSGDIVVKIVK